ncbi:DUF4291 domain-containing protein [Kineosporia rhizophila]|uniref:DUF4291 domain-containing protein n=1 Tax=Kineosporia rhizophila TaxID=84633 RepID=UPI001E4C776D|nr:DUF4291 domain-containing protein [Kineosporia rhizophila]MCE0535272.1 DUF4291 domain-containing protein [Kineosporia rhizophila]
METPHHQVRATWTESTITVYQAYSPGIAEPALAAGRFVTPFRRERMTWIKPSFRWMMYRSGWATKPGQERVLAVELTRTGFEAALTRSCASSFDRARHPDRATWARALKASPVRYQWDPERSLQMQPLPFRSLQLGLSRDAVDQYVDEWIVGLHDVTGLAHQIHAHVSAGEPETAQALLPPETPYPLPPDVAQAVNATL